jgi:hypothetical protein
MEAETIDRPSWLMEIGIVDKTFKSFDELKAFLEESEKDLELLVYPKLKFGAIFWISDEDSGLGGDGAHPWVILSNYEKGMPIVTACLRTSSNISQNKKRGLYQPAGMLKGLDREGVILPPVRKPFQVRKFRDYRYEGQLPDEWVERLRQHLDSGGKIDG